MARHSKWHKVKQFKGAIDQKRAASFTKLSREITVAVREKGADSTTNSRLATAIDRAKKASMTKDTIERAIQRGTGVGGEADIEELTYGGYGPGGAALIIECLTDNRNLSTNDVKHLVTKAGGSFVPPASVMFLFEKTNGEWVPKTTIDLDETNGLALEELIEALEELDDVRDVYTNAA